MPEPEDNETATGPQGPYKPFVPESSDSERPLTEGTADEPDDSLLQAASSDVGEEIGVPPPEDFKPKRSGKKFGKVLLILILLAGIAGGAYYYFMVYKKAEPAATPAPQVEAPAANTFTPENVAYAFAAKNGDPYSIYSRPAAGGDRVEATLATTTEDETPKPFTLPSSKGIQGITSGQAVAILNDNILFMSQDGGKTYAQVYELKGGQTITSMKFSTDSSKLAFALLDNASGKNTVTAIDLDGQNETKLFSSSKSAVVINAWDQAAQKVVYQTAAKYGSDGYYDDLQIRNLESEKTTKLLEDVPPETLKSVALSNDLNHVVYSTSTIDPSIKVESISGSYDGPPYTISTLAIENSETEKLATIGKKGDKNPNGTYLSVNVRVGFLINSDTPYYTDKDGAVEKLLVPQGTDQEAKAIFESATSIEDILYANSTQAIVYTGADANDSALINNTVGGETVTILEGDANTVLFGTTTK